MGVARDWKGFAAPARWQIGWMPDVAVAEWPETATIVTLRALSTHPDNLGQNQYLAASADCDQCSSFGITGGYLFASFRDSSGYDRDLGTAATNKVHIHILRAYSYPYGRGTERLALLGADETFFNSRSGHAVKVCFIVAGDSARIAVASGPAATTNVAYRCAGTSAPPLPPNAPAPKSPPPRPAGQICEEDCRYSSDGDCDDGGEGA
eukprot:3698341-Pleurochrysis_carterae.AAC.1